MAHDELDELLAVLARERAVIDRYKVEAHGYASADYVADDYTATDQLHSDERSVGGGKRVEFVPGRRIAPTLAAVE